MLITYAPVTRKCQECAPTHDKATATPGDNSQMIFKIVVNGRYGRALLDSGAPIDFVDRRYVEALKPAPKYIK